MSDKWLRFGVGDGHLGWAATWKLWVEAPAGNALVHLGSRFLGGRLTARRAPGGGWVVDFERRAAPNADPAAAFADGAARHWQPCLVPAGGRRTTLFRILTPAASVSQPYLPGRHKYIAWIPKPPPAHVVDVAIIATGGGWPVHDLVGQALLGSLELPGGGRVSVMYRTVAAVRGQAPRHGNGPAQGAHRSTPAHTLLVGRDADGIPTIRDVETAAVPDRPG